jgi:hypothetical protein
VPGGAAMASATGHVCTAPAVHEESDYQRSVRLHNPKDVLDMRPIYHRTDIFVAALAFLLHRAIEKKLKADASISSPPKL